MCVIAIEAEDHGSPKLSNRAFVNILLNETNDHDPVIRFRYYLPFPPYKNSSAYY